jgi:carnosine N-methyltransferase
VLVPGSGLGRLAYQIARLGLHLHKFCSHFICYVYICLSGYRCQGNEWSMFMLIASHFILNLVKGKDVFVIYPWVLSFNNNMTVEDQLKSCHIPDIDPHDLPPSAEFSMTAGDFNEVYKEPDSWDCVVTCYFIDTSPNVVAYIETIKSVLKPGGYWINFGPLLYHFSDMSNEHSVELSYEMIHRLILDYGFELVVSLG